MASVTREIVLPAERDETWRWLTDPGELSRWLAPEVELELPPRSVVQPLGGHRLHWLRCRITETTGSGRTGATYSHPPEIYSITAAPMGARLPSTHASRIEREIIGVSDGTPGQVFPLRHRPVLKIGTGETLEVQDPDTGDWVRWEWRTDFVGSTESTMFSVTVITGISMKCWWTIPTPWSIAALGEPRRTLEPLITISPSSGW